MVHKRWGHEQELFRGPYMVKKIVIRAGCSTSMHRHADKTETILPYVGSLFVETADGVRELLPGDHLTHQPGETHRHFVEGEDCRFYEASTPHDESERVTGTS